MKTPTPFYTAAVLLGLTLAAGSVAMADEATPEAVESTPSEIKDQDSLGAQVDDFNQQNRETVRNSSSSLNETEDSMADPQARDLAQDVDNYNEKSTNATAPSVDTNNTAVDSMTSEADRQAADKLKTEVRNYNRNGGSSNRGVDDGED